MVLYCCNDPSEKEQCRQHKSSVKMDSGASADWGENFYFVPADYQNKKILVVEAWDNDRWTADDLIGSSLIGLSSTPPPDSRCMDSLVANLSCPG